MQVPDFLSGGFDFPVRLCYSEMVFAYSPLEVVGLTFLDWLKIVFLGIVEGITEWLPISSTGHLILVDALWKSDNAVLTERFMEMFTVVIQFGAILAVVVLYFGRLWPFALRGERRQTGRVVKQDCILLWLKIAVSCVPAILVGLPLDDWLDAHLYNPLTVSVTLIVYGIGFLLAERRNRSRRPRIDRLDGLTWSDALLIGVFQVLALIPGTSRSGATILGGILIGLSRETAAEYTFFLAVPVMFGASLLKLVKFGFAFTNLQLAALLLGMTVSFVVSVLAIRFLMGYLKKHDFTAFGWYRIALGIPVLLLALLNG